MESVTCISCQVVYADPEGGCHMQLPIFIDDVGACHVSLSPASDIQDGEAAAEALSHICLGSCPVADESRRDHLRGVLERALKEDTSAEGSAHRRWLQGALGRLGSFERHSAETKDALRHAILAERTKEAAAAAATERAQAPHTHRQCFLTYVEQRQLLSSH